jgi:hypothetical protein
LLERQSKHFFRAVLGGVEIGLDSFSGSKDFSRLSRKVRDKSEIIADATGSSGLTGQATIKYIEMAFIIERQIRNSAI